MQATIIIGILRLIMTEAPGAIAGVRQVLNKDNPTDADWEEAKQRIQNDTFANLAPDAEKFRVPEPPPKP